MPKNALRFASDPVRAAIAAILALTVWRLLWLPFSQLEFYVDEAQYWLWGQELAFGAYSKPPVVGWLIRAANEVTGSDAAWVARAPWPVCHAIAALAILGAGRILATPAIAALASVSYATLPAVSLGSVLISTDSPEMMFLAITLWLWARARAAGTWNAAALGFAIGLAILSKYSMLFSLAGIAVALWFNRALLPQARHRLVIVAAAVLTVLPNVVWNMTHGFATFRHTAENSDFKGFHLQPVAAAEFLISQFVVAGPVLFAALIWSIARWRQHGPALRSMAIVTLAPLLICTVQALNSGANANWAVGAYVPGVLVAAAVLVRSRLWTTVSLAINAAIALALPILPLFAETLRLPDGRLLMERYVGNNARSAWAIETARHEAGGQPVLILSGERAVTAQLFYDVLAHDRQGVTIRALPPQGKPDSHYELVYPLTVEQGPAFYFGPKKDAPGCASQGLDHDDRTELSALSSQCLDSLR